MNPIERGLQLILCACLLNACTPASTSKRDLSPAARDTKAQSVSNNTGAGQGGALANAAGGTAGGTSGGTSGGDAGVNPGASAGVAADHMPEGINKANCTPQAGRQFIFLIHGTLQSSLLSFKALAPRLQKAGHCVYSTDYGALDSKDDLKARKSVAENVQEVSQAIDRTLKQTGQKQIDLLGFSQGGLIGFHLIRDKGFAGKVRHFTAVSPSVRGTQSEGALRMNAAKTCQACADQFHTSAFMREWLSRPLTVKGVAYTVIATRDDWIVTPPESQFVQEDGVRNVLIQDRLNGKTVSHVGMMYDEDALNVIVALVNERAAVR